MTTDTLTRRPALVKLSDDVEGLRDELVAGFDSRRAILEWLQRLVVRTLGELPAEWVDKFADEFKGVPGEEKERTLLAALLTGPNRVRAVEDDVAEDLRERMYALYIRPAFHRAFRELRGDATEYLDDDGTDSQHAAPRQRWIAMRPALDELERYQERALGDLLDGFDDKSAILDWGADLELATHGEIPGGFVSRCYREESTMRMLTGTSAAEARGRELFAAKFLVPAYNRGVRELSGRTGEQADSVAKEEAVQYA